MKVILGFSAVVCFAVGATLPALADQQAAIDGCIDQLMKVGGPDAANGGEVIDRMSGEAGHMITLRDAGGTAWECIAYDDGAVGDLSVVDAADDGEGAMAGAGDDGGGAMDGVEDEGTTTTEQVKFTLGTSGAKLHGELTPGSSMRYVLGASDGQFLKVHLKSKGTLMSYQIFNPDNSFLLDLVNAGENYKGQLFQSGDHVIEVINRGDANASYTVDVEIQ